MSDLLHGSFLEAAGGDSSTETGQGLVIEAAGEGRFRVRILRAGLSINRNFYPDAALREAVPLFEGARVIVKDDGEHLRSRGRDPRAVLGRVTGVTFVPGPTTDSGALEAVFEAIDPADPMIVRLREAAQRSMLDLFGLSIDARAKFTEARGIRTVTRFTAVNSVDLIVEPGAGGRVLDVLEAADNTREDHMDRARIIALIKKHRPGFLEGKDIDALTNDDLEALLAEAMGAENGDGEDDQGGAEAGAREAAGDRADAPLTREDLDRTMRTLEARGAARERVSRATLPDAARTRVLAALEARGDWSNTAVDAAIRAEQEYLRPFVEAGRVAGLGAISRIEMGETRSEKVRTMLEAFFDPGHRDHRHARSFRECYATITGDHRVTGLLRNCDQGLMREALDSTSFSEVLGDAIHRRLVADYRTGTVYDIWRNLVTTAPVGDFRKQERTRFGGYGDIPIVAEGADYQPVTSPDDESAEYAVRKRGGIESITLEMIKNDDVGVIQRLPTRMSRAAKRTLAKFVLDFIRTNPTIYDSKALFHADHHNLATAALSSAAVAAMRLAMLKQTEPGSGDALGIAPKYLWVPADLEEAATDIFKRDTNLDETFVQSLKPTIVPVWYWTDANDWAMSADTADLPTIEVGFLDGDEEPQLFVQDNPSVGSMFSSDKLTWKMRHVYGGNVVDFRGLAKSVVA